MIKDYKPLKTYIIDINKTCKDSLMELNKLVHKEDATNKVSHLTKSLFNSIISTIVFNASESIGKTLHLMTHSDMHMSFPELQFISTEDYVQFDNIVKNITISVMEQIIYFIPLTNNVELVLDQVTDSIIILTLYGGVNGDF